MGRDERNIDADDVEPVQRGSGVAVCQVDKIEEDDSWADVKVGDVTALQSATTGSAYILWSESGTGVKWAIVRLSNSSGLQLFELKDDLQEQDTIGVPAWKISITDVQGWTRDNTTADHTVFAAPSFRGYGFGVPAGQEATLCGTVVAAVRIRGRWQAVAGGSGCFESTVVGGIPGGGGTGDIDIDVGQGCIHRVPATNLGFTIQGGDTVLAFFCHGGWYVLGTVLDPPGINPGCGLKFQAGSPSIWQVDNVALAGPGLKTWNTCGLEVDLSPIAGCGLKDDGGGTLSVDPPDLAGTGLTPGAGCSLDVDLAAGCGISINGNEISVDNGALAGSGLVTSGTCGLAVNPKPGGGVVLIGGQLQILAGCGIRVDGSGVSFNADAVAGLGLRWAGVCGLEVDAACGLTFDSFGRLETDGITVSCQVVTDVDKNQYGDLIITRKTFNFVCGVLKSVT